MYVFDMDGTLSLPGERLRYIRQSPKNWEAFFSGVIDDEPNWNIVNIYCALKAVGFDVCIVTGRPERTRGATVSWLRKWAIDTDPMVYMRPDLNFTPDHLLKPTLIDFDLTRINCVFEDRARVVDAWRNLGVLCVQVDEGDY